MKKLIVFLMVLLTLSSAKADIEKFPINESPTLMVQASQFSSGAVYAASPIVWEVYEDGVYMASPAQTGNLTVAAAAASAVTGRYYYSLALTAVNGYEVDKFYTVYVAATVDTVAASSKVLTFIIDPEVITAGLARAGAGNAEIQLAATTDFVNDILNGAVVTITAGTGVGQQRIINDWVDTGETATLEVNWITNPDATSKYEVRLASVNVQTIKNSSPIAMTDITDTGNPITLTGATGAIALVTTTTTATNLTALTAGTVDVDFNSMAITSTTGDAVTITSGGGDGHGVKVTANGSGDGINITGGLTGDGINLSAGATSGTGLSATGVGAGSGFYARGGVTAGSGIHAAGYGGGAAMYLRGQGAGNGLDIAGGTTGHSFDLTTLAEIATYVWVSDISGVSTANYAGTILNDVPSTAEFENRTISTTAAGNMEDTYDGTGYSNGVAPATQEQLDNIANTGAAINKLASGSENITGTPTNTYTSTQALDGVYHSIAPATTTIAVDYNFDIGTTGVPVSVTLVGRLYDPPATSNSIEVFAYDWVALDWSQVGELTGTASANDAFYTVILFSKHVGTGSNDGLVNIRFTNASIDSGTIFYADLIYCSYAVVSSTLGYANGSIWVDTVNGTAGTVEGVNGVADFPVDSWADAVTLAGLTDLYIFQITNGSAIELTGNSDNYMLHGIEYTLALAGQSIANSHIKGAVVSGISAGTSARFEDCKIGIVSLTACGMKHCAFQSDITLLSAGTYIFDNCFSAVAGITIPSIDFGAALGDTNLNLRHYSGGIEIKNMGGAGTDKMSLEGWGQLVIADSSDAGTIAIRGAFTITDNAAGGSFSGTLSDNARYDTGQIASELATYDGPTNTEMEARTLLTANYYDFTTDSVQLLTTGGSAGINAEELVDLYFAEIIEATYTYKDLIRVTGSYIAGDYVISGTTYTYEGLDGATTRIVGAASSSGRTMSTVSGD